MKHALNIPSDFDFVAADGDFYRVRIPLEKKEDTPGRYCYELVIRRGMLTLNLVYYESNPKTGSYKIEIIACLISKYPVYQHY